MNDACFECGSENNIHQHHIIPQSRGGTATVPLCGSCHAKAHGVSTDWDLSTLTSEALKRKKNNGEYTGGKPPYGYQVAADGVHLEEREDEQETIEEIRRLREEGLSLREIGARLEGNGFTTRRGGKFWPTAIRNILKENER